MKVQNLINLLLTMDPSADVHAIYVEDTEDGATAVDVQVINATTREGRHSPQVELVLSFDGKVSMQDMVVEFPI